MPLSCSCDCDYDPEPGEALYYFDKEPDFSTLDTTKAKRCASCNKLIKINDVCVEYTRYRYPYNDIEARIVGFDWCGEPPIQIAPHYHCERCGEIFLNLRDIGYECLFPDEDMEESLSDYLKRI